MKFIVQLGIERPYYLTDKLKMVRSIKKAKRFNNYTTAAAHVEHINRLKNLLVIILPLREAKKLNELVKVWVKPRGMEVSSVLHKVINFNNN